jgi:hypothetical protein
VPIVGDLAGPMLGTTPTLLGDRRGACFGLFVATKPAVSGVFGG